MVVAVAVWPAGPFVAARADDQPPAFRLDRAAVARAVSMSPDTSQRPAFADAGDWSEVVALAPGREIILTTDTMPSSRRRVVAADQAGITLLNLFDPRVPDRVKRVLRGLLQQSPETLARVAFGSAIVHDEVRFAPEGIFLEGRRVADVDTVLLRVMRADVVEVREDLEGASSGLMIAAMVLVPAGAIWHAKSGGWRQPEPDINKGTVLGLGMMVTGLAVGGLALKRGSLAGRSPLVYRRR